MKKMVEMYQDEIVPGLRKQVEELEKNQVEVRCKDCNHFKETNGKDSGKPCGYGKCMKPFFIQMIVDADDFCSYGERKEETEPRQDCTYNKNGRCIGQKLMPECDPKACDRRK